MLIMCTIFRCIFRTPSEQELLISKFSQVWRLLRSIMVASIQLSGLTCRTISILYNRTSPIHKSRLTHVATAPGLSEESQTEIAISLQFMELLRDIIFAQSWTAPKVKERGILGRTKSPSTCGRSMQTWDSRRESELSLLSWTLSNSWFLSLNLLWKGYHAGSGWSNGA